MAFPQYAKSTHPEVLAAAARDAASIQRFHEEAVAFAQRAGDPTGAYASGSFLGRSVVGVLGVDGAKPPVGRWKRTRHGNWYPFKNTELEAEIQKIRHVPEAMPGLPDMFNGPINHSGSHLVSFARPFVVEGAAYLGFSFPPVAGGSDPDPVAGGWTEIKASEYFLALEALRAAEPAKAPA